MMAPNMLFVLDVGELLFSPPKLNEEAQAETVVQTQ
jgi:hypothetical protein